MGRVDTGTLVFFRQLPPPLHCLLKRVGFSWQLPGTGRQMGESVGKIPKEGFRAHEWEIPDNLSFLSEVTERGRIKCGISGKYSPDTHQSIISFESSFWAKVFTALDSDPGKPGKLLCGSLSRIQPTEDHSVGARYHEGR